MPTNQEVEEFLREFFLGANTAQLEQRNFDFGKGPEGPRDVVVKLQGDTETLAMCGRKVALRSLKKELRKLKAKFIGIVSPVLGHMPGPPSPEVPREDAGSTR